jgi:hypothetical protein
VPRIHRTKTWQVEIPEGWKVEGSDEAAMLYKPDGVGTLMVFSTEQSGAAESTTAPPFSGRLSGTVRSTTAGGDFRRTWTLACRGQMLFARYQCALKNAQVEVSQIDQIMQSISEATHD